jgi:3-oxosteroid 1-dehydrogenase
VLGADGRPIPALFGAGNCIGSPVGGGYFGPGGTIGPALTFGYIASRSALHELPRWAPRAQQPQAPLRPLRV